MKEIVVIHLLVMKTAFQVEAFSEWSGQSLVAADHLIGPPPFYKVLRRYPARRQGHNYPAGHNHPNDWSRYLRTLPR